MYVLLFLFLRVCIRSSVLLFVVDVVVGVASASQPMFEVADLNFLANAVVIYSGTGSLYPGNA